MSQSLPTPVQNFIQPAVAVAQTSAPPATTNRPPAPKASQHPWVAAMEKLVAKFMSKREAFAFLEPVDHVALNLPSYPDIVKYPMDLATVKRKLENKKYRMLYECAADVRLIWANAMLFNYPGSDIFEVAKTLSEQFEQMYVAIAREDQDQPPNLDEMQGWADKYFQLTPEQGGRVLMSLEKSCPKALTRNASGTEVDVNIHLLSGDAFRKSKKVMEKYLPDFGANTKFVDYQRSPISPKPAVSASHPNPASKPPKPKPHSIPNQATIATTSNSSTGSISSTSNHSANIVGDKRKLETTN
jgi:hypothetical protein